MVFRITQGDTSPSLVTTLRDGSSSIELSNVEDIRFIMQDRYERVKINQGIQENLNIVDSNTGKIEYVFSSEQTSTVGTYQAEFEVEYDDGAVETFPTGDNKVTVEIVEQIA